MANEKYYDYFKYVNHDLMGQYSEEVGQKRHESLQKMLDNSGAIAYTSRSSWGGPETVAELVYPYETELKELPHVMTIRTDWFEDQKVVVLRGKLNSKAGKEFNKWIDKAREELKELPNFKAWVIDLLDVKRTGLAGPHESGRGTAMIETDFAMREGIYLFRIPKSDTGNVSGTEEVPKEFTPITYGQWFDIKAEWD